jgi:hypothetical protein
LADNVLWLVNSALDGLRGTVNSIRQAVFMAGDYQPPQCHVGYVGGTYVGSGKNGAGWSIAGFSHHSVGVALSDLIAESAGELRRGRFRRRPG